ncbi:MAG: hypothetical protein LBN00_11345 [Oscillospiraceae bacterium]|jgi:hypothetical protein|nr:hypothetical protein [Oscillospiraceae bacterium]
MKKIITILLAAAMVFSLTACGLKKAVQDKTQELLQSIVEAPAAPGGESGGASGGTKRQIAGVAPYWERVRDEWENAPNEGYVWTITINDSETLDVLGLATVNYNLNFSCSHVGPDMFGPYKGEMEMSYDADLSGMIGLMTITGGSVEYDADGWFKNDDFIMVASGYAAEKEDDFTQSFEQTSDLGAEEQAIVDEYMDAILGDVGSGNQDFENSKTPVAHWYDWDFHMTEGDMSGYITMTGIAYGTTSGSGSVDASGVYMQGSATASAPFVGTFSERYSEEIVSPFPYILRLYETGEAVFELHSANGGPVTVKFYGTIDKIPVGDTQLIKK